MDKFGPNKAMERALEDRDIDYEFDENTGIYRVFVHGIWEDFIVGEMPRDLRERISSARVLSPLEKALR